MARSNPKPTARQNGEPKAGKKKNYREPPRRNKDNQDRREAGEQQFQSKINFTEEVQTVKIRDNKLVTSTKHVSIPYKYDPTRKRIVVNSFYNWSKNER